MEEDKEDLIFGCAFYDQIYREDLEKIRQCVGFEPWMENWITFSKTGGEFYNITLIQCFHPDECIFYASTNHQQAVDAFTLIPYEG